MEYLEAMNTTTVAFWNFGDWLEARLLERDMRQYQLAEIIGTSPGAVSSWVNNVKRPTRRSCRAIADALEVPRDDALRAAGYILTMPGRPGTLRAAASAAHEEFEEDFQKVLAIAARDHKRLDHHTKGMILAILMYALFGKLPEDRPEDFEPYGAISLTDDKEPDRNEHCLPEVAPE